MVSIYVEGKADKRFIEDTIKYLELDNILTPEIIITNGYQGLKHYKQKIELTKDLGGLNIVIFDADQNKSEKEVSIKMMDEIASYFFFPNNNDNGDLEDLLSQIINPDHKGILDCFEDYQTCVKDKGEYILPNKKARIYAYCEAVLPKKSMEVQEDKRNYLDQEIWKMDSPAMNPLLEFLRICLK